MPMLTSKYPCTYYSGLELSDMPPIGNSLGFYMQNLVEVSDELSHHAWLQLLDKGFLSLMAIIVPSKGKIMKPML